MWYCCSRQATNDFASSCSPAVESGQAPLEICLMKPWQISDFNVYKGIASPLQTDAILTQFGNKIALKPADFLSCAADFCTPVIVDRMHSDTKGDKS